MNAIQLAALADDIGYGIWFSATTVTAVLVVSTSSWCRSR
jgi:hypothetical protein